MSKLHSVACHMASSPANVAVLGATGSIGVSTLEVIAASEGALRAIALSGHANTELLLEQAQQVRPRWLVVTSADAADAQDWSTLPADVELRIGPDALLDIVTDASVDIVLTAIVGSAGLRGTWAALEAGKTIALANKETLVMAGPLVMALAKR